MKKIHEATVDAFLVSFFFKYIFPRNQLGCCSRPRPSFRADISDDDTGRTENVTRLLGRRRRPRSIEYLRLRPAG